MGQKMIHSHSDKKIKTCKICQKNIEEIIICAHKLDLLGIWDIPKKLKKGKDYMIWKKKKETK